MMPTNRTNRVAVVGAAGALRPFLSASDAKAALSSFGAAAKCAGEVNFLSSQQHMSTPNAPHNSAQQSRQDRDVTAAAAAAAPIVDIPLDVPVFLQNTYRMIDSCHPSIAGWCGDGLSFVIKDADRLASEVIPRFFKHNKYSSFVRQLNFYGFRKAKGGTAVTRTSSLEAVLSHAAASLLSKQNSSKSTKPQQIFHHECFVRGRPDLLRNVKRPSQVQGAIERQEVDDLKREVKQLKTQMAFLVRHIQQQHHHQHNNNQPQAAATASPAPTLGGKRTIDEIHPEQGEHEHDGQQQRQPNSEGEIRESGSSNKRLRRRPSHFITPPPSPGISPLAAQDVPQAQQTIPQAIPLTPASSPPSERQEHQEHVASLPEHHEHHVAHVAQPEQHVVLEQEQQRTQPELHETLQQREGNAAQQRQEQQNSGQTQWEYEASLFADETSFLEDLADLIA